MGLLDRTNPAATPATVRRAAAIGAVVFLLLYVAFVVCSKQWSDSSTEWSFAVVIPWTLFGAFIFALMDWQPPDMPDVSDVVYLCEVKFAIRIDRERLLPIEKLRVGDLHREVLAAIKSTRPTDVVDEAGVWMQLRDLVVECLSVDKDEVTPEARFLIELA